MRQLGDPFRIGSHCALLCGGTAPPGSSSVKHLFEPSDRAETALLSCGHNVLTC